MIDVQNHLRMESRATSTMETDPSGTIVKMLRRLSGKLSMFRKAMRVVGAATAIQLELSRLIYRLGLTRLVPLFTISVPGAKHKLYLRTGTSDYNVFLHVFVLEAYGPSLPSDSSPKFIIDCGANIGYSSVYFLNRFAGVKVVAVEPDPGNMSICRMNLKPYGADVALFHAAVWSHPCRLELLPMGPHAEQSTCVAEPALPARGNVQAVDIPGLMEPAGEATVDLLKIDIEGSELELFTNADGWLRRIRNIAIELHGKNCQEAFLNALADYDYSVMISDDTTICHNIVRHESMKATFSGSI